MSDFVADLTAEQIDAMPAGRELDDLVAQVVLGWHRSGEGEYMPECWFSPPTPIHPTGPQYEGGLPAFSGHLKNAGLVIDHMRRTHYWEMRTEFRPGTPRGDLCWVGLTPHGVTGFSGIPDFTSPGETLELAICRVSLRCVLGLTMPYDGLSVQERLYVKRCSRCKGSGEEPEEVKREPDA